MERGIPIKSVTRVIAVLKVINRHGSLSLTDIVQHCGLPYPTASRIIQTLLHEGLIEREPSRKYYRPTALVQALSLGFRGRGNLIVTARPYMEHLTETIGWPVALVTRVGQTMVVADSTHKLSPLTFNIYYPGYSMPVLECASGHVFLAYSSPKTRANIIKGFDEIQARSLALTMFKSGTLVEQICDNGFATYDRNPHTKNPGKTSSIAVPIFEGNEVAASLTLGFFSSTMPVTEAVKRYARPLKLASQKITDQLPRNAAASKDLQSVQKGAGPVC